MLRPEDKTNLVQVGTQRLVPSDLGVQVCRRQASEVEMCLGEHTNMAVPGAMGQVHAHRNVASIVFPGLCAPCQLRHTHQSVQPEVELVPVNQQRVVHINLYVSPSGTCVSSGSPTWRDGCSPFMGARALPLHLRHLLQTCGAWCVSASLQVSTHPTTHPTDLCECEVCSCSSV